MIDFPNDPGCSSADDDTEDTLALPACSDNRDNDKDGNLDYPNDPGCPAPQHDRETDDCPDGPNCPQCGNGRDDDGNGMSDFGGADPGCDAAGDAVEFVDNPQACGPMLKIKTLPATGMDNGLLDAMSTSAIQTTCNSGVAQPAVAYLMVLNKPTVVVISTNGSTADTVVDLRRANCLLDEAHIACNDNVGGTDRSSRLTQSVSAGAYYIIVSGKGTTATGPYTIQVSKFNGEGEACSDTSECGPGLICRTPVNMSSKICAKPVCRDGLDDDSDGRADYPADPGCANLDDGDEVDDCPSGPLCPDCADGLDNDGDASTDYPTDTSCKAAGDASEACITSESIEVIAGPTTTGDTSATGVVNDYDPICNSSIGTANDLLYRLDLPRMTTLSINVTGFDTVHTLFDSSCGGSPIACSDPSLMTVSNLAEGTYYLTVEGWSTFNGPFTIQTSGIVAGGGSCEGQLYQAGAIACAAGFVCDGPPGAKTCRTECTDGIDNNGDGNTDYPNDPGCGAPNDNSETTVCPGVMCPACSDGIDNDNDTKIDYPADNSCLAAGGNNESCTTSEPIGTITTTTTTGTTAGQTNDSAPPVPCGSSFHTAPDLAFEIDLPAMALLNLNLIGFDGAHYLLNSSCQGAPIACSDPSLLAVGPLAAGKYFVVVDGWSSGSGAFTLTTSGQVAAGGSCEGQLFQSNVITCQPGFVCDGPAGARTCRTQCTDGIDNNGDGTIDYPNDPGCGAPNDNSEDTVCPGTLCPACSDTVDNDGDGNIDYPADPTCIAAGGSSESCVTSEPILQIAGTTTTGTTAGQVNDYKPICGFQSSHTAPDLLYELNVPALQSLTLNLTGFDGAHSLLDSTCGAPPIACSDPSFLTVNNLAAGRYFVSIDGWSSGNGAFTLTTNGVIAAGASCESPLFTSGTLTCPTGLMCQGAPGARTCRSQCSDGIDNNGDGKIDFPNDPSCTSLADNTEVNVCPGASCPACGDTIDNDADTTIDFPADVGCASAAGTNEVFCSVEPDFRGVIANQVTTGTLAAPAVGNYNQSCQSNTGNDVVYALSLPVPVRTLVVSTAGSLVGDTVLSVKDSACGVQLGCNDDVSPGIGSSLLTLSNLSPGSYAIQVDSYNSNGANNGPFTLNVRGTVNNGVACTSPLFTSGVLACQTGATCTAGVCQ